MSVTLHVMSFVNGHIPVNAPPLSEMTLVDPALVEEPVWVSATEHTSMTEAIARARRKELFYIFPPWAKEWIPVKEFGIQ